MILMLWRDRPALKGTKLTNGMQGVNEGNRLRRSPRPLDILDRVEATR